MAKRHLSSYFEGIDAPVTTALSEVISGSLLNSQTLPKSKSTEQRRESVPPPQPEQQPKGIKKTKPQRSKTQKKVAIQPPPVKEKLRFKTTRTQRLRSQYNSKMSKPAEAGGDDQMDEGGGGGDDGDRPLPLDGNSLDCQNMVGTWVKNLPSQHEQQEQEPRQDKQQGRFSNC